MKKIHAQEVTVEKQPALENKLGIKLECMTVIATGEHFPESTVIIVIEDFEDKEVYAESKANILYCMKNMDTIINEQH